MDLSEIAAAAGTTTTRQRDRGVATVDATDRPLAARLADFEDELPCEPAAAAAVVEAYADGASVGESARVAGVAPVTAAKTLHLLGVEGISPLGPTGREIVRDWLAAELTRSEARELAGASEATFALAAYVETHDPIEGAREAAEQTLAPGGDAMVSKRDRLGETMSDVGELL